ncbi:MAG TPA: TonB-dependent receptor [Gemmatimonadales bacterium]|nr:TonB-dependent receptor [Gemmatimonadales bacterium]
MKRLTGQVLALLAAATPLAAQGTGVISGRVHDVVSGRGLHGAMVRLVGGPAVQTDTDGTFRIREVHPGYWTITVAQIGYNPVTRDSLVVRPGEVLRLEVALSSVAIRVADIGITVAQDRLLDPLAPAETQRITAADLHNLPVSSLDDALAVSAGAVGQSYRGGRVGEQAFILDGVGFKNQLDASTGGLGVRLPPDLLTEASLVTNGFSARYGQAISGLVNVVTRDGGDHWEGRTAYETDRPFGKGWDYGLDRAVVTADGPLPGGVRILGVLDVTGRVDADPVNAPPPTDPRDPRSQSPVLPGNSGEQYDGAIKLSVPVLGAPLRMLLVRSVEQRRLLDPAFRYDISGSPAERVTGTLVSAQVQRSLGSGVNPLLLDLRFGYFDRDFLRGTPTGPADYAFGGFTGRPLHVIGEDLARRQDTIAAEGPIPGIVGPQLTDQSPYGVPAFFLGGGSRGDLAWNHYRETRVQADFTAGAGENVDYYFGGEASFQRVQTFQRALGYLPVGDSVPKPSAADFSPIAVAAYTEMQARMQDLALTAGLRYDLFDARTSDATQSRGAHGSLNPRLAVSTVLKGATFVASWGRFSQAPDYQYLVDAAFDDTTRTGRFRVGNPDLGFEQATQYEFSVRSRPSDKVSLKVGVYVKRLDKLVASVPFGLNPDSTFFGNLDHGSVRGLEVIAEREVINGLRLRASYTLQEATASGSDAFRLRTLYLDPVTGDTVRPASDEFPLDYDRRHNFTGIVEYRAPDRAGPSVLGGSVFGGLSAAAILRYQSGLPYSRYSATGDTLVGPPNSYRLPDQTNVDLLVRKPFRLLGRDGSVYFDARNLFNSRDVIAVDRVTGTPGVSDATVTAMATAAYDAHPEAIPYESPRYRSWADLNHDGLISGPAELMPLYLEAARDYTRPLFTYGPPRLVRVGMELRF